MRRATICVLVLVGLLAVNSFVQADIVKVAGTTVFDNSGFEGDAVGGVPSVTTVGSWTLGAQNANKYSKVVNGAVPGPAQGSNYLQLQASGQSNTAAAVFAPASAGQSIHAAWEFYIPEADLPARQGSGTPYNVSLSGDPAKTWYSTSNAAKTMWGVCYPEGQSATYIDVTGISAGDVAVYYAGKTGMNGNGYANVTVGGQNLYIATNVWHTAVQDYVENAATYSLKIDGVQCDSMSSSYGITGWGYGATQDLVHWQSTEAGWTPPGGYYAAYIDGNSVPEPSTVVLLLTGLIGLVAYAWRKRR